MVKVTKIDNLNDITEEALVSLYADTKEEVVDGMDIFDMPVGYNLASGSTVITAKAELAFYQSDGTWNWV